MSAVQLRAGRFDRRVSIETKTETLDDYGAPAEAWRTRGNFSAELVDIGTTQTVKESGAVDSIENVFTLRIRWLDGLTVADRLQYEGKAFDIIALAEIPRRRGWEIRARRRGP